MYFLFIFLIPMGGFPIDVEGCVKHAFFMFTGAQRGDSSHAMMGFASLRLYEFREIKRRCYCHYCFLYSLFVLSVFFFNFT